MSAVTNENLISQPAQNIKARLEDAVTNVRITDPLAGGRSTNKEFIRVTEARKDRYYPHILVQSFIITGELLSVQGTNHKNQIQADITVIANNLKDLDQIMNDVHHEMLLKASKLYFDSLSMRKPKEYCLGISPYIREDNEVKRTATYRFKAYTVQ